MNLISRSRFSAAHWMIFAVILYRWGKVNSVTRKIILKINYTVTYSLTWLHMLDTYIQCRHIWHRNKLSRCQLKLLVCCSNDEHQTSLKCDSCSHPVAPKCRVSHTLHLKHFTVNVLSPSEICRCTFNVLCWSTSNVPAIWKGGFTVR